MLQLRAPDLSDAAAVDEIRLHQQIRVLTHLFGGAIGLDGPLPDDGRRPHVSKRGRDGESDAAPDLAHYL